MIETAALPILMKAIDFLFDEGKKILDEQRERRKTEHEKQKIETNGQQTTPSNTQESDTIKSREVALNSSVTDVVWRASEEKITHLLSLLEIHTKNYYLVREQYAKFGSAFVPPIIANQLSEEENEIAKTTQELQGILTRLYGKEVKIIEE